MSNVLLRPLLRLGWSFPLARAVAPRRPVIVLYHGVPADDPGGLCGRVFEQHVLFLKRHFEFVGPENVGRRRQPLQPRQILMTFDDGFRNNAEVAAPILRQHRIPAVFFVSSRHAAPGKFLWFSYLKALERLFPRAGFSFRNAVVDMSPNKRRVSVQSLSRTLLSLTPHPAAMYRAIEEELPQLDEFVSPRDLNDSYAGMTAEQVAELAADPLFSIGSHTVDHPFLTRCEPAEAVQQIERNRTWLEAACGRRCDSIAYPSGDYSADLLKVCRQAGFSRGYAVASRLDPESDLELPRIGIYSNSTDVLGFKMQWGPLMRKVRIPVG